MAHLIDFSNNRANIALVGQPAWHGLGSILPQNAPLEVWLKEAGMEWEAKKAKSFFIDDEGVSQPSESHVVYRSDTKAELGTCSDRYQIVQPKEVIEFYRDLVATQDWSLDVAGCLDGGRKIWALAKTEGEIFVKGTVDKLETYLLLATSFDGSLATVCKFSSVRTVCSNTLTMALNEKGTSSISVSHSTKFNADKVKEQLGIYASATAKMENEVNAMASDKISDKAAMRFIIDVLEGKNTKIEDISTRGANIIQNVFSLYSGNGMGSTLKSADGTLWGVVNSITQYYDHEINARSQNNRLRSAWFGQGDTKKTQAYNLALDMLGYDKVA